MAKPGNKNNKLRCENYRKSGRKAINKQLRQERHEKRMAKFAKRRADGKTYEYKPNPYEKGTSLYYWEQSKRARKCVNRKLPLQEWTSTMRKLRNQLAAEKEKYRKLKMGRGQAA